MKVHKTADVSENAILGNGTMVWHGAQIREGATIGEDCIISKGVYIDHGTKIGDRVKIQNYVCVYHKAIIEDGVFLGPLVVLTNDKVPRAINTDGSLKTESDWESETTIIRKGASIGTGSILMSGIEVGKFALVGAGTLVTKDVPPHGLVYGHPGEIRGWVCKCGNTVSKSNKKPSSLTCSECK